MPSVYLDPDEYDAYGVPGVTAAQVQQASTLIDGYLLRPQGLVYKADANGNPAYMLAMTPALTFTATAAFAPGEAVVVPVAGPIASIQVGDCVVLDRSNDEIVETVQITSIDLTAKTVTLGSTATMSGAGVQFSHESGCALETGLVITQQKYMPKGRSEVMLSYTPVARVVGGTGRYAYGRRGDDGAYNVDNYNLLASLQKFGGPPAWEIWPANTAQGVNPATGQLWVPAGIMLVYYSEVCVRYVTGFAVGNVPSVIKQACAQIIQTIAENPMILGNVKSYQAGGTKVQNFASTVISSDVKDWLAPYRAHGFV